MGQVKILAIGNSFSQDATHFLHQIAAAGGIDTKVVNLYIGGCSLERHWQNIEQDSKSYLYEINGETTERFVSIEDMLKEEDWDFIVTQQASHYSGMQETYYPFVVDIFHFIKEHAPNAEILLHQTWAYETDSTHEGFLHYDRNQKEMYERLCAAYQRAADKLKVRLIPCGDVVQNVRSKEPFAYEKGGMSLCRDGFHMNYLYGRYLLAATWYEVLLKKNIIENSYIPKTNLAPSETADSRTLDIIKDSVHKIVAEKSKKSV